MIPRRWPFGSVFLGGFEASWLIKPGGRRIDLLAATQHDVQAAQDYARCRALGFRAVRETARWPSIDRGGAYALDDVRRLARLGREAGLTQIWGLMHYGYPDDIDPFSAAFADRFARYAGAVARALREETDGPLYVAPVNEISFHAWAADAGHLAPHAPGRGLDFKRQLVRAAIRAADAIWAVDPEARIVTIDPVVRQHPPPGRPDLAEATARYNREAVFHSMDMLSGRAEPELGGSREHLGILGLNYYTVNQSVVGTEDAPGRVLARDDPAYTPLSDILAEVAGRYGGPLFIAETGAHIDDRPGWIAYLAGEAERVIERGVDLWGICFYPLVTSPDWEDPTAFFDAGLLDVRIDAAGRQERVLSRAVAVALRAAQRRLDPENEPAGPLPPEEPPAAPPPVLVARPLDGVRARAGSFAYDTLLAGDGLVVERYAFEPGAYLHPHRHPDAEHVLTVLEGRVTVELGGREAALGPGETLLVPANAYHAIRNPTDARAVVQQVSAPKPWDARHAGPAPSQVRRDAPPEGSSGGR